ncbi:MAG: ribonuclease Z [Agarilytica sp.]
MEFIFLGTSSGIPTNTRNVSGLVIKRRNSKNWCLVDCGEGTQHQLLRLPYSLPKLDTIFITHVHGDHCYGLPGLLASAAMAGRKAPVTLIGPQGVWDFVSAAMSATDMHMSYDINFIDVDNIDSFRAENSFNVSVCALSHRVPSYAYVFDEVVNDAPLNTEKLEQESIPKGPLWGRLAKGEAITLGDGRIVRGEDYKLTPNKSRRIIVGGDNDTPALLHEHAQQCDVLIHESTYTQAISEKVGPAPQHSSARDVGVAAQKAGVKNLVLTHFSARYHLPLPLEKDRQVAEKGQQEKSENAIQSVFDEAKAHYSGELFLANDFDQFVLSAEGDIDRVSLLSNQKKLQ